MVSHGVGWERWVLFGLNDRCRSLATFLAPWRSGEVDACLPRMAPVPVVPVAYHGADRGRTYEILGGGVSLPRKLLVTSATLVVTSALLVVTRS